MIINVTGHVRIVREDPHNWTIQHMHIAERGKKAGQPTWKNCGYYGSLEQAAGSLINDKIDLIIDESSRVFDDIREFMATVERAQNRVIKAIRGRKLARSAKRRDDTSSQGT